MATIAAKLRFFQMSSVIPQIYEWLINNEWQIKNKFGLYSNKSVKNCFGNIKTCLTTHEKAGIAQYFTMVIIIIQRAIFKGQVSTVQAVLDQSAVYVSLEHLFLAFN